ncbi:hypothetical protein Hypma_007161 [Hypsizygus marmoreus]|uniref:F-box domain-containing protein n=1 Tax=Hypsizygus marmoreus TaxID=39966 RepID=A0A369KF81_HYPMA|nr:hypothetical protein Hypma_007161 [Hypsizygus marmoreus]
MLPTLPPETIDAIIDQLCSDKTSLGNCSLASSIFTATARHHLFSEVVLDCSSICTFLKLLDVPWCTIPPAMISIVIGERKKKPGWNRKKTYYVPQDRPRLVSRLQGVRDVRFQDISLGSIPPPFWRLLQSLQGVRSIEIYRMTFETPVHFFQYMCSLPALEELSISKSSMDAAASELTPYRLKAPFCIPLLDVEKLSPGILSWFLAQDATPPVHTFRVNLNGEPSQLMVLRQYAEAMGPSILHLHVNLPGDIRAYNETAPAVPFDSFTHVRSIHFEGYIDWIGLDSERNHLETFMETIFTQLSSSCLSKVSLSIGFSVYDGFASFGIPDSVILEKFDWGRLPEIVAENIGDELQEFHLVIRGVPFYQQKDIERALRAGAFSAVDVGNVLRIDFP